jgi:DNA sulfur modification protein DndD
MMLIDLEMFNFMPYRGKHRLAFPTVRARNVMVVLGANMRGKTSLLNAIRWCFYGEALDRQLNPISLPLIVNSDAADEGEWRVSVYVSFEANGNTYDLRRVATLRELVARPRRDEDFTIEVSLRRNSTVLHGDQIEHEINQIMPAEISRFFLFDAELLEQYEALVMEDSDQGRLIRDAIEKILGVPALVNGRDELRTLLKKAQVVLAKENKHIEGMEAQAEQYARLQVEIESLNSDTVKLRKRDADLRTEIADLDSLLESTEAAQRAQSRLEELLAEQKGLIDRTKGLKVEQAQVLASAWKDLLQPRLQATVATLLSQRDALQKSLEHRGAVSSQIDQLKALLAKSKCGVCGQDIARERRDDFGRRLGKLEGDLTTLTADMERAGELSSEITQLSKLRGGGAGAALRRIETELTRAAVDLTRIEGDIDKLRHQVAGHDTAEIARQRTKRDMLLQNIGRLQEDLRRSEQQVDERVAKQNQLSRLMSKSPAARTQRSALEVEIYEVLGRVFAGGVDVLRDRLRNTVAAKATEAFHRLTTEKTYKKLQINESYGLTIIDRNDRAVPLRSTGAEQIVALSLIDGLNRAARKTGPIIIDTPLGRLDPKHRANVLMFVPSMAEQVVLLAHEGEIDRGKDLQPLAQHIGAVYEIERISSSESRLTRLRGQIK